MYPICSYRRHTYSHLPTFVFNFFHFFLFHSDSLLFSCTHSHTNRCPSFTHFSTACYILFNRYTSYFYFKLVRFSCLMCKFALRYTIETNVKGIIFISLFKFSNFVHSAWTHIVFFLLVFKHNKAILIDWNYVEFDELQHCYLRRKRIGVNNHINLTVT